MKSLWLPALTVSVASILFGGCATPNYMSSEVSREEINLAAEEIERTALLKPKYVSDSDAERFVYQIFSKLYPAAVSVCRELGEHDCHWDVRYDTDEEFNAFASEQSVVTIQKGVVKYAKTEEELALVIAHEMSHHAANHIEEMRNNAATGSLIGMTIVGLLSAYANQGNIYGQYNVNNDMQTGAQIGQAIGRLSYSKDQENEADYLAFVILNRSGYGLEKPRNVFKVMAAAGTGPHGGGALFSSHPSPAERLARWDASIEELQLIGDQLVTTEQRKSGSLIALQDSDPSIEHENTVASARTNYDDPQTSKAAAHQNTLSLTEKRSPALTPEYEYPASIAAFNNGCEGTTTSKPQVEIYFQHFSEEKFRANCADGSELLVICYYGDCSLDDQY